jgi:dTDP-4-dehydrorhamnose 3,5-epimerase-like enzyme
MEPKIISGSRYNDERGSLSYNNDFEASHVKRIYYIENKDISFVRGWQGHKIEQRWFSAVTGSFIIRLIKIDNWESPSADLEIVRFELTSDGLNVLHIPAGYATSIQAVAHDSKLLVMADYLLGELTDDYRYDINYFN